METINSINQYKLKMILDYESKTLQVKIVYYFQFKI